MGSPLMAQSLTSPHPYPCENHAPSQFSFRERSRSGSLIKYAYVHDDKLNIYAACPNTPSVTDLNLKHSITNQWRGLGL